jgi:hypothetical protein
VQPDGRTVSNLRVEFSGTGPTSGAGSQISVADSGPWSIQADHTFTIDESGGSAHLRLNGVFNGEDASGSCQLQTTDGAGATRCDTGSLGWSVKLQK